MSHRLAVSLFIGCLTAGFPLAAQGQGTATAPPPTTAKAPPAATATPKTGQPSGKYQYPKAERGTQVDTYHGVAVPDPYRWLEDPDAPASREWIEAQNELTQSYLAAVEERGAIKDRLTELWNYERFGVPFKEGDRYFYSRNDGLQNQNVLFVAPSLGAEARVLLDPNTLSKDGTIALAGTAVSEDGKYLAYGLAEAGSDWNTWKVRDVATGEDLADEIKWVKFSGASWLKDGSGFFYSRYDEPKPGEEFKGAIYYQKLFFHKLGTPQHADVLVYQRADQKEWGFGGGVTEDGDHLVIHVSQGTDRKNRVFYRPIVPLDGPMPSSVRSEGDGLNVDTLWGDIDGPNKHGFGLGETVELLSDFDAAYDFVGNDGSVFWFVTDLEAPRGRLIAIDTRNPARSAWKEIIPQTQDTLRGVSVVGDHFLASYLKDAKSNAVVYALDGKRIREVDLPGIGSAGGFDGERDDPETFYSFTGYTVPGTIYRYDVRIGESTVFKQPDVQFDPDAYETKQVFYTSKDGTRVPMFITHRKGLTLDGNNPTLLYGYGGFNIPITPGFAVSSAVWMEMGGVYAVANIRGGGEYGEAWHKAGTKLDKQNVFDDFIGAAEWLIENGYTSSKKLAINGGSNGGLLVGACMTQRPDLFGACLPAVGVLDMLRFHTFTIGWAWTSDYGSAEDADPEMFKALYAYSPYHNTKPGTCYPATMITTADHDDRVVPAHSFKFAAALQAAQGCDHPVLIRIETRAGHGAGKPTSKRIEELADQWAFLVRALDMRPTIGDAKGRARASLGR